MRSSQNHHFNTNNKDYYSNSNIFNLNFRQSSLFNLADFDKKKVEVSFTLPKTSSDVGLLLLREVDNQIGLIDRLTACIDDNRHQSYVKHSVDSMMRQRIMQIKVSNIIFDALGWICVKLLSGN